MQQRPIDSVPQISEFANPCEVVSSAKLDLAQKLWLLRDWFVDERALLVADDEGMRGTRSPRLGEVRRAILVLEAADSE